MLNVTISVKYTNDSFWSWYKRFYLHKHRLWLAVWCLKTRLLYYIRSISFCIKSLVFNSNMFPYILIWVCSTMSMVIWYILCLYLYLNNTQKPLYLLLVRAPSKVPVVSLSKKRYSHCLVLVGSRNGFELDLHKQKIACFTIELN